MSEQRDLTGAAELAITDFALPRDKLAISFNSAAKQLAAVNINSYLGKKGHGDDWGSVCLSPGRSQLSGRAR